MDVTANPLVDMLLENPVVFPDGQSFERLQPMTDFRRDPNEARILFLCRRVSSKGVTSSDEINGHHEDDEFVMKIKVQVPPLSPEHQQTPLQGPSVYTAAELKALETFRIQDVPSVPHLIASKSRSQDADGLFRDGYISYTIMTKMPGRDLMSLSFWSLPDEQREVIRRAFLERLKMVWKLGFAPYDCALRNILWDAETRTCSIVDFEHWQVAKDPINMHETEEMQAWGIVQRPPSATWWAEWGIK